MGRHGESLRFRRENAKVLAKILALREGSLGEASRKHERRTGQSGPAGSEPFGMGTPARLPTQLASLALATDPFNFYNNYLSFFVSYFTVITFLLSIEGLGNIVYCLIVVFDHEW